MSRTFTIELTDREVTTLEHLAKETNQTVEEALRHLHRSALFIFVTVFLSEITVSHGYGRGPMNPELQKSELDKFTKELMSIAPGELPN